MQAWRDQARGLLAADVPPHQVIWSRGDPSETDLFARDAAALPVREITVPRSFVSLAEHVVWHRDPERFARLYAVLYRMRDAPGLMQDRADYAVSTLHKMAKEVRRDKHKMTAFVRFREIDGLPERRRFAAWFEPTHYIMEPSARFFANRFGDMDWIIFTPHLTAECTEGQVSFRAGAEKPSLPEDATEELWRTYFRNIFNPARLKVQAMQSEMPRKYWKNLPEADLIPEMIQSAQARAHAMAEAAPTLPPVRAGKITERLSEEMAQRVCDRDGELANCRACPLWRDATQVVPGEGPRDAKLMVVGEQPGDHEDLQGRPFVGPAGQLFDQYCAQVGLVRDTLYLTNAVKHFKFTPRGKRRIHKTPSSSEIAACNGWLQQEISDVQPRLILTMGASALRAVIGDGRDLMRRRGGIEQTAQGVPVLITMHPSHLLRLPPEEKDAAIALFRGDLQRARDMIESEERASR